MALIRVFAEKEKPKKENWLVTDAVTLIEGGPTLRIHRIKINTAPLMFPWRSKWFETCEASSTTNINELKIFCNIPL